MPNGYHALEEGVALSSVTGRSVIERHARRCSRGPYSYGSENDRRQQLDIGCGESRRRCLEASHLKAGERHVNPFSTWHVEVYALDSRVELALALDVFEISAELEHRVRHGVGPDTFDSHRADDYAGWYPHRKGSRWAVQAAP